MNRVPIGTIIESKDVELVLHVSDFKPYQDKADGRISVKISRKVFKQWLEDMCECLENDDEEDCEEDEWVSCLPKRVSKVQE